MKQYCCAGQPLKTKECVEWYINKYPVEHCFESPHLIASSSNGNGANFNKVCDMAKYFLPDNNRKSKESPCDYEYKGFIPQDFEPYYTEEWKMPYVQERKHLDKLAVGAFDQGKLIGLAGCSADCETMYQIGVDVLPEYRKRGIASAITRYCHRNI